ncbi:hypothetical protein ACFQ77_38140 [Streptomyces virginiae]|uniref:hypothetical protein n=1 Tax=Streptomyces virginiae TaxID=1961 RepID=UPI0036A862C8
MHDEQQQLRPWGAVTSDFWERGQTPRPGTAGSEADSAETEPAPRQPPAAHESGRAAAAAPAGRPEEKPAQSEVVQAGSVQTAEATVPAQGTTASASPSHAADRPVAHLDQINAIIATFSRPDDRDGLATAAIEAEQLDQEFTAQYGQRDPHTVSIREIRGWLALLMGQPTVAARWYLHTTGLQIALHGATHANTDSSMQRAIHTWQQVKDPAEVVQIGTDLAKVVTAVFGEDTDAYRYIQARVAHYRRPQQ